MLDWKVAVQAAQSKKAEDISVLDIGKISSFTDTFVICTGANPRQVQAVSDAILETLKASSGIRPLGVEGYSHAEWILMDYGDFVVHVLSPQARQFYGLERLWKNAPRLPVPAAA